MRVPSHKTFNSLTELYSHTDARLTFDPTIFVPRIMELGDIYTPDEPGMYDQRSGALIVPFDGQAYSLETDRDGRTYEHNIQSEYDLSKATNDVMDRRYSRVLLKKTSLRYVDKEFRSTRPLWFRARELAIALAADVIQRTYQYRTICRTVRRVIDCVERDELDAFTIESLDEIEERVRNMILERVGEPGYNEIVMDSTRSTVIIDVKLDIRIRDWEENRLRKEQAEQEERDAHGEPVRHIY